MIEKFALAAKILICVLAGFFVLMSLDVFEIDATIGELIGGFLISIVPAIIMVAGVIVFWKKEQILAYTSFGIAVAWTIFIIVQGNGIEMLGGILIVDIPLLISGTILLLSYKKQKV